MGVNPYKPISIYLFLFRLSRKGACRLHSHTHRLLILFTTTTSFFFFLLHPRVCSPTRDQTHVPCWKHGMLTTGPSGKSLSLLLDVCTCVLNNVRLSETPMDCSPRGSSVHEILQARILGWLPFPPTEDLLNLGIEPKFPAWQADSSPAEPSGKPYSLMVPQNSRI